MYAVYVLRSVRNNKRYVGSTVKLAGERLKEHNQGSTQWTRQNKPFKLIYTECYLTISEARKREKFFKSGQGRKWLDENVKK